MQATDWGKIALALSDDIFTPMKAFMDSVLMPERGMGSVCVTPCISGPGEGRGTGRGKVDGR